MLTMFTTPKPFRGHIKVIQTSAIRSWVLLRPQCEIILFGNEEGTADIAARFGVRHIPDVGRNEFGTPLISSMFDIAQDIARHHLMCYVNADIILMSDFLPAIRQIDRQSFLLIGQRWDIDVKEPVDFDNPNWEDHLRARLAKEASLHAPTGIDYFVFPRGMYRDIPPLTVGRAGWDNWMVHRARMLRIPVIDGTKAATVVHQNHDYAHHPEGKVGVWQGLEAQRNQKILGGYSCAFDVRDATWVLTTKGTKRISPARILYRRGRRLEGSLIRLVKRCRLPW